MHWAGPAAGNVFVVEASVKGAEEPSLEQDSRHVNARQEIIGSTIVDILGRCL